MSPRAHAFSREPFRLGGALGVKVALGISCSPELKFPESVHQTLLDGLEGVGGGDIVYSDVF